MPVQAMVASDDRLTVNDAAELLGTTVEKLYRLARDREVPSWKIGHNWRFSRRALEEFMAAGGTQGAAA